MPGLVTYCSQHELHQCAVQCVRAGGSRNQGAQGGLGPGVILDGSSGVAVRSLEDDAVGERIEQTLRPGTPKPKVLPP